jgi:hypothetical protein
VAEASSGRRPGSVTGMILRLQKSDVQAASKR